MQDHGVSILSKLTISKLIIIILILPIYYFQHQYSVIVSVTSSHCISCYNDVMLPTIRLLVSKLVKFTIIHQPANRHKRRQTLLIEFYLYTHNEHNSIRASHRKVVDRLARDLLFSCYEAASSTINTYVYN